MFFSQFLRQVLICFQMLPPCSGQTFITGSAMAMAWISWCVFLCFQGLPQLLTRDATQLCWYWSPAACLELCHSKLKWRNDHIFITKRGSSDTPRDPVDSGTMLVTAIRSQPAILVIQFRWGFLKLTCSILSPQKQTLWCYMFLNGSLQDFIQGSCAKTNKQKNSLEPCRYHYF